MLCLNLKNLYQELNDKTLNENVNEQHKPYYREWAGEMAQPLSKSTATVEDQSSDTSTYIRWLTANTPIPRNLTPYSGLHGLLRDTQKYTQIYNLK